MKGSLRHQGRLPAGGQAPQRKECSFHGALRGRGPSEGGLVLDPFARTGAMRVAAQQLGRHAVGL